MFSQNSTNGAESSEASGLLLGGRLSVNVDASKFDIEDGNAFVLDNHTDPINPTKTKVTWSGLTALTVTNIATHDFTFVAINSAGAAVQQVTPFTDTQGRDLIILGILFHSDNVNIAGATPSPILRYDLELQLSDFANAIGAINTSGNVFFANGANLNIDRSIGSIYRLGSNYNTSQKDPSTTQQGLGSPQAFSYQFRDGAGGFETQTPGLLIDPTLYDDDSGTLASVPSNDPWTVQHIWTINENTSIVAYGQATFKTMADAEASISTTTFETAPITSAIAVRRSFLIVATSSTNLSDGLQAKFIEASSISASGGSSGGGSTEDPTKSMLITSLNNGGVLSINANTALFDISNGDGFVVNNYTNPDAPVTTTVSWSGLTAITVTNIATQPRTFVGLNSSGVVIQQADDFTHDQRRDIITLGALIHDNNIAITNASTFPTTRFDLASQFVDFIKMVGAANLSGNVFSPNGVNLNVNRSAGEVYRFGANYAVDKKSPSISTDAPASPQSFEYIYQDGAGNFTTTAVINSINPEMYDDGTGILASVPVNDWTIQRIWIFNSGFTNIMYDQNIYQNIDDAEASITGAEFNASPTLLENAVLRGWLIVQQGATNLSSSAQAKFIEASKFGTTASGGVSSSTTTLQQAYNNSTAPQVVLDAAKGVFALRDNATPIGTNLFEVADSAGTAKYIAVDTTGIVAPSAVVAGGDLVLVKDIDDSNTLKTVTAQSIADLGGGGAGLFYDATGGTITTDGDFRIHTFNANGNFEVLDTGSGSPNAIVVAGGGGGGGSANATTFAGGGPGGAGGLLDAPVLPIGVGIYPVVIGAGGAGGVNLQNGANGQNSSFSGMVSIGGGAGVRALSSGNEGLPGGSGGGGTYVDAGGASTQTNSGLGTGHGNSGGTAGNRGAGGGGGAGTIGVNGSGNNGGNGGAGFNTSITGGILSFAGGGGGGAYTSGAGGAGGAGGGGAGGDAGANGVNGTANTGGGGGGSGTSAGTSGGTGGSGVVIIRYKFQ